jgi:hypothetical protein
VKNGRKRFKVYRVSRAEEYMRSIGWSKKIDEGAINIISLPRSLLRFVKNG